MGSSSTRQRTLRPQRLKWSGEAVPGWCRSHASWVFPSASSDCPTWARARCRWKDRSEEHTSELQSRVDLVCRLLLEKKKKKKKNTGYRQAQNKTGQKQKTRE